MKVRSHLSLLYEWVLLLTLVAPPVLAQQPRQAVVTRPNEVTPTKVTEKSGGTPPGNKTIVAASLALTSGQPGASYYSNPLGAEFEFMFRPTPRHQATGYYVGLIANITGTKESTPFIVPGAPSATLESHFNTSFLGLSQYYFLASKSATKPFVELDLGLRIMNNFVYANYEYYPPLPYKGSDEVVKNRGTQFSAGLKFGLFFQVLGSKGLFLKTGISTGGDFDVCQNGSVISKVRHEYTFQTVTTSSVFLTMNVGVMF